MRRRPFPSLRIELLSNKKGRVNLKRSGNALSQARRRKEITFPEGQGRARARQGARSTSAKFRLRPISTSVNFDFGQFLDVGFFRLCRRENRKKKKKTKKMKEHSLGGAINIVRVCVKAAPAEGRRRFHRNTAYARLETVKNKSEHMRGSVLGETSWARAHGRRDKAGKLVRTVSETCQERS